MGAVKLSDTTVAALTCPAGRKDIMVFDMTLKGFGLRVTSGGARVFLYQYRVGTKVRRFRLGDWPTTTTAKARKLAEGHRGAVGGGEDPVAERKAKHAAELAADAEQRRVAQVEAFTVEKLVSAWEIRSLVNRRPSYRKDAPSRVRAGLSELLQRPATTLTRSDAAAAIASAAATRGPVGANRIMAYASACYGWGMKANLVEANPFAGLARPGREQARDRALSAEEVRAVWRAAGTLGGVHGAYVQLLLVILQRREDVAGATWSEISRDLTTWTIPAERAKNGRAHFVHLVPVAQALLGILPRAKPKKGPRPEDVLVFALPGGTKLSAFSSIKRRLDKAIATAEAKAAVEEGREAGTMLAWTFHDFRRSGVTALAGLGFAPHVCDRLLNHVSGSIQGVAAVYQRAEFLAERKAALEAWADFVAPQISCALDIA